MGSRLKQLGSPLRKYSSHQTGPDRKREALCPASGPPQVQPPLPLFPVLFPGLCRILPNWSCLHRVDKIPPLFPGVQVPLRLQLGIGVLHRYHCGIQMGGQGPLGGQLLPRFQAAGQDVLLDAAIQIVVPGQAPSLFQIICQHKQPSNLVL